MSALRVYGKGLRTDPPHRRALYRPFSEIALPEHLILAPGTSGSIARFEARIMDQGSTSSCTGHGTSQAIVCALSAGGLVIPFVPSPADLYKAIRCWERPQNENGSYPDLTDSGGMPSTIVLVTRSCGVTPIRAPAPDGRYSDVDPSTVNEKPETQNVTAGGLTIITGEYAINPQAPNAAALCRAAISAGFSLGIGMFVDTAFEEWGENWTPANGPISSINQSDSNGGGHWICANEFALVSANDTEVGGPNSWSDTWGAPALVDATGCPNKTGGHYRLVLEPLLASGAISDIIVFKIANLDTLAHRIKAAA